MERKKGRLGRPLKPASERKPDTISFRVREGFRDRLAHAASRHDRPINAEIEDRLQESLEDEAIENELAPLHVAVRGFLRQVRLRKADKWNFHLHDPGVADALRAGFDLLVAAFCVGPLSDEQVKRFWIETAKLHDKHGVAIAQIPAEAFTIVANAERATKPSPTEIVEWVRTEAAKKG